MIGFKHIVVGLDLGSGSELTPGSQLALDQATLLAKHHGARLTLLHSTAADEHWEPTNNHLVYLGHGLSPARESALVKLTNELDVAGFDVVLELSDERAWLAIVQKVLSDEVDLIVVGKRSHASGGFAKLGSVCTKLVRKCPCPVWAVKEDVASRLARIVAAIDLGGAGEVVLDHALDVARRWQAELHLVTSFQMPMDVQLHGDEADFVATKRRETVAELKRLVDARGAGPASVRCHAALTSPTHAIEAAVREFEADLVVMGSIGRSGVPGLLVGNTAERLLSRLDCSLLVIKPVDFVCPIEPK